MWQAEGWGEEGDGRKVREGGDIVYLWLILIDVWQKTKKFCKAITLQLKNLKKKLDSSGWVTWNEKKMKKCIKEGWNKASALVHLIIKSIFFTFPLFSSWQLHSEAYHSDFKIQFYWISTYLVKEPHSSPWLLLEEEANSLMTTARNKIKQDNIPQAEAQWRR